MEYNYNKIKKYIDKLITKKNFSLSQIAEDINCSLSKLEEWYSSTKEKNQEITESLKKYIYGIEQELKLDKFYTIKNTILPFFSLIMLLLNLFFLFLIFYSNSNSKSYLEIISPKNNEVLIGKDLSTTINGEIIVQIKLKTKNIPSGYFLTIINGIPGGEELWVSATQIPTDNIEEIEVIDFVTFGRLGDNNEHYSIQAVVTKEKYKSGDVLNSLPQNIYKSKKIFITIKK